MVVEPTPGPAGASTHYVSRRGLEEVPGGTRRPARLEDRHAGRVIRWKHVIYLKGCLLVTTVPPGWLSRCLLAGSLLAIALLPPGVLAGAAGQAPNGTRPQVASDETTRWRADREAQLRAENGWLSVAGLFFPQPGVNSMGSAPGSASVSKELPNPDMYFVVVRPSFMVALPARLLCPSGLAEISCI